MHSNTGWFGETHVSAIAGYVWRDVSLGIRLSHPTQIPHCRLLAPTSRGIEHLVNHTLNIMYNILILKSRIPHLYYFSGMPAVHSHGVQGF